MEVFLSRLIIIRGMGSYAAEILLCITGIHNELPVFSEPQEISYL